MAKYLIFDSGAIINLTQNCLVSFIRELSHIFQGEFIITDGVKYEIIDHPMKITRFEWGAIRIQSLLDEDLIKMSKDEELVDENTLMEKTKEVMNTANNWLFDNDKPIHLIERGESECIALSLLLREKGIESAVVIDERTARMLCESPENLKALMEEKLHAKLSAKLENVHEFQNIKVIRSAELAYMAYKKGLIEGDKTRLEAMLYALKFGGCSISEKEIQVIKKS